VHEEVPETEKHGEGLLQPEDTDEGPFPVELCHGLRRGGRDAPRGDYVLACVVAFLGACPEEKAEVESCAAEVLALCIPLYVSNVVEIGPTCGRLASWKKGHVEEGVVGDGDCA